MWDAMGSIAVGLLMGAIALQLMKSNKRFLIGALGWRAGATSGTAGSCRQTLALCGTLLSHILPASSLRPSLPPAAGQAMEPQVERSIVEHLQNDKACAGRASSWLGKFCTAGTPA